MAGLVATVEEGKRGETACSVYVPFAWLMARDSAQGLRYNS